MPHRSFSLGAALLVLAQCASEAPSSPELSRPGAIQQPVVTAFGPGSLIIPMDVAPDGQDDSMLRAYGLVYELLRHGVPVYWIIGPSKSAGGVDFSIASLASVQTFPGGALLGPRSYRGGPFVIAAPDAATAAPIITRFLTGGAVTVHELVGGYTLIADVARVLVSAPRIAILSDGNQAIAMNDLNAAGIFDGVGGTWTGISPDVLSEADVVGPS